MNHCIFHLRPYEYRITTFTVSFCTPSDNTNTYCEKMGFTSAWGESYSGTTANLHIWGGRFTLKKAVKMSD